MSRSYTSAKNEHQGEKPSFELDGTEFVCEGGISTLDISEFAMLARSGVLADDPAAAAVFAEFFKNVLGDDVYDRFKKHTRAHGTDPDVFVEIMQGLIEDFLGRPTQEPSSSPDGPSTTGTTSRLVSLQQGSVTFQPPPSPGHLAAVQAAGSSTSTPGPSSMPYTQYG